MPITNAEHGECSGVEPRKTWSSQDLPIYYDVKAISSGPLPLALAALTRQEHFQIVVRSTFLHGYRIKNQ